MITDPNSIVFSDSLHGFITAGFQWEHGEMFSTADGGRSWQLDTAVNNTLESVVLDATGRAYACGLEGLALFRAPGSKYWEPFRIDYCWNRGCVFPNDQYGLIVSAEGYVRRFGPDAFWKLDTLLQFPTELTAVCFSDYNTVHAVGMGWVMRSADAGRSWARLPVTGDYFRSVHFPDAQTGYICGYNGTLLKTRDGGQHWEIIRKGGAFTPKRQPFRSIRFFDAETGFLAGEDGILWHTVDGGAHWNPVEGAPADADFTSVFLLGMRGWAVAKGGMVFRWEE